MYFPSHADCRIYRQEGKMTELFLKNIEEVEHFVVETLRNEAMETTAEENKEVGSPERDESTLLVAKALSNRLEDLRKQHVEAERREQVRIRKMKSLARS